MANNIFFYSTHPDDKESEEFLKELDKNPLLKSQFKLINIYQHKIPDIVKKAGKIPVLVTEGFNEFITGSAAISWLKNGGFQGKANGYEFADMNANLDSVILTDEMKKKNDALFVNSSYNRGFDKKQSTVKAGFLPLKAESHIEIYEELDENKRKLNDKVASSKLKTVSSSRKNEDAEIKKSIENDKKSKSSLPFFVPPPPQYKEQNNGQSNGQSNEKYRELSNEKQAPTYNANPFASGQRIQLPFNTGQQPRINRNI